MASYIAELRHETPPSWVLHSSARRTTQTAEITFPDACLIPDRGLYEADIDACVATLQEQAADHDVVAIGIAEREFSRARGRVHVGFLVET